jgi:DNA-binding SARP family transcriptional activator/tetratricopeptide (TPR) repeat protein
MQFRLLGPLEVVDGDRSLALGGRKQRSLLAMLLLHANDVLSTELLVDEVWGGSPPATVAKSVQVYVSRLRKELGDGRLVTRSPGYLLRVEPSELDLARFQALVAEAADAEPAAAAAKLREALGLWRGPPLADLAYEPFAQSHVARLEDQRFTTLEQRIAADLASGEHAQLTGELEALVAEHPLRERLHGQLMLALYRSGRQAEALAAYQAARATLVDELGIEPGRELRDLHEAILMQDPGLDLAPVIDEVAASARRSVTAFVGRERELELLGDALEDALAGRGRLVLIAGEPGIGKSRLTDELIGRARTRGARILVGRCWEAGGAPAYWPWVQALRAHVRETEPDALSAQVRTGAAQLAALLPELRELLGDLPEPAAPDSDGARFLLFDAVSSFVSAAAQARPLVLVLDDVHAADEPSLLLLRFVAREIAASRLLIVCAYRDVDPTVRDPLASTLAALVREPHATQVALGGLSERDVEEYLELTTGSQPARELVAALHAETDGNALFVAEVVSLLDAEGRLDDVDAPVRIPPGVRAVIGQRLARLAEPCRHLLDSASVLGREFDLQGLAALSGMAGAELLDVLDGAVAERVVVEVPRSPGRLRFGHALIRDTLYDELPPARRLRLHGQAGEALENVYRADVQPHLAELARHFFAAAPSGPPGKALAYARRAGDHAASQLAHEEAERHYEMALTLSEEPSTRCELLLAVGEARARAGATDASKAAFLQAADLAEAHGLPDHLGKAALGYGGRLIWDVSRDDQRIVPLLERAIEAQGDVDSAMLVRLLSRLAGGPLRDARFGPERKVALSAKALDMARRLADPATLAHALHASINSQHGPDHTRRNLQLAAELVDVSSRAAETERIVEGHEELLDAHLELGDIGAAKLELAAMEELARELRQPSQDWLVTVYRAIFELLEGRFDEAERSVESASHLGERAQSWNAAVTYRLQLYVLRREQDRLAEVESLVRQSVADYPTYPIWRCVFAQTAVSVGLPDDARDVLAVLGRDRFAALPVDEEWLVSACLLAEAASALTDVERASVLYELLLPFTDRVALSPPEISIGAVARYAGLLAATIGRPDDARRHFADAIEINRRIGARPWLARTQDDLEAVLAAARGG